MPHLVVFDIETEGLDDSKDAILEIGAIVVDADTLEELGRFECLCPTSREQHEQSDFIQRMHTENGLFAEIESAAENEELNTLSRADWDLSLFLRALLGEEKAVLAGFSVGTFDHRFVRTQLPLAARLLSHRVVDFGDRCEWLWKVCGGERIKPLRVPHRAMADCAVELKCAREAQERLAAMGRALARVTAEWDEEMGV